MQKKIERVAVFIDGSNLYFKLRSSFGGKFRGLSFDYSGLCKLLVGHRQVVFMGYYIGAVKAVPKDRKAQELRRNQQKLFETLRSGGFSIKLGHLMQNDGVYHEKGVDVQLALDIVIKAYEKEYDTAIIVSSDTDLVPAIKTARNLKRSVEYVGFSVRPSFGMQKYASRSKLLGEEELEKLKARKSAKKLTIRRFDDE